MFPRPVTMHRLCGHLPQHFLNFLPEPQGHGSFGPTFSSSRWYGTPGSAGRGVTDSGSGSPEACGTGSASAGAGASAEAVVEPSWSTVWWLRMYWRAAGTKRSNAARLVAERNILPSLQWKKGFFSGTAGFQCRFLSWVQ